MKPVRLLSVAVLAFILSACNSIDTPDGKIPAEYLSYAQPLVGTYVGEFNGHATTITLALNGQTPVVTINNNVGDLLDSGCDSSVGPLKNITTSNVGLSNQETISDTTFAFSPGRCRIEGRELTFSFGTDQYNQPKFEISLARDSQWIHQPGYTECIPDGYGHMYCHVTPGVDHLITRYITGKFRKSN